MDRSSGGENLTGGNVDDITTRLNQINVNTMQQRPNNWTLDCQQDNCDDNDVEMSIDDDSQRSKTNVFACNEQVAAADTRPRATASNILIVTNLDPSVFGDSLVKAKFESLFSEYDRNVTFRYLKSFRRVRLDFTNSSLAELARTNLNNHKLANHEFKCYSAQLIRPNSSSVDSQDNENDSNTQTYLSIPKPTKQFLISPPASPPVGWEPVTESSPCIDVQLISAIANLVPGQVHQIHSGSESQPGIYVEVCEDAQFESQPASRGCPRIPRTANPAAAATNVAGQ